MNALTEKTPVPPDPRVYDRLTGSMNGQRIVASCHSLLRRDLHLKGRVDRTAYNVLFDVAGVVRNYVEPGDFVGYELMDWLGELAMYYMELLQSEGVLIEGDGFDLADREGLKMGFETALDKRRLPDLGDLLEGAMEFARANPLAVEGNRYLVLIVNAAFHLHKVANGAEFVLPVSEEAAAVFGTTKMTLSSAIQTAIRRGFIMVSGDADRDRGQVRRFLFNQRALSGQPLSA